MQEIGGFLGQIGAGLVSAAGKGCDLTTRVDMKQLTSFGRALIYSPGGANLLNRFLVGRIVRSDGKKTMVRGQ